LLLRSYRIRGFCIRHFSLLVGQFCVFSIAVSLAIFSKLNCFLFCFFLERKSYYWFVSSPLPPRAEFFLDSTSILATRESVRRFFAFDRGCEAASDRDWPLCFILKLESGEFWWFFLVSRGPRACLSILLVVIRNRIRRIPRHLSRVPRRITKEE
jgi:hypothetical protein